MILRLEDEKSTSGWQKTLQRASVAGRKDKGEEKFSQEVQRGEQLLEEHNLKIGFYRERMFTRKFRKKCRLKFSRWQEAIGFLPPCSPK